MKATVVSDRSKGSLIGYSLFKTASMGLTLILVAKQYPNLLDAILEAAQNALDAGADHIWLSVNQKARTVTIKDNGEGRDRKEFDKVLASVLESLKNKKQLGRFGMGLVAPLDKCERYLFTTTKDGKSYIEWEFVGKDIVKMDEVHVPCRDRSDLVFDRGSTPPRGKTAVKWKTEVYLENYSQDRIISRLTFDSLKDEILAKFGVTMRRLGTIVSLRFQDESGKKERSVDIQAEPYSGEKLETVTLADTDAGKVVFNLYLAKLTEKGRRGVIKFGEAENDYRVNASTFVNASGEWLHKEAAQALTSGFFEGEILAEKVRIHPGRKGFLMDDTVVGLCSAIDEWYRRIGGTLFEELREAKRDKRYQELSLKVLRHIEDLMKKGGLQDLKSVLLTFRKGSVGTGHTEPDPNALSGETTQASKSTQGGDERKQHQKKSSSEGSKSGKPEPEKEHTGHNPFVAPGPNGRVRSVVRSNSLGFAIIADDFPGKENPWTLDVERGILHVNARHIWWKRCEDTGDSALTQYLEYVALQALVIHSMPEDWRDNARLFADETLKAHIFMLAPDKD